MKVTILNKNSTARTRKEMIVLFLHFKGEPFTQEEMEEMLSAAVDPEKNVILYKDFAALMTVEDY